MHRALDFADEIRRLATQGTAPLSPDVSSFLFSYHISVYTRWSRFTCAFFHTNTHTPKAVTYHEPTAMIGHITVGS